VHVLVGLPAPSYKDRLRFEGFVFNALLGGGMTSHLYQKIREKKGLVYSVYSMMSTFTDSGLLTVYASSSEENFKKVMTLILEELKKIKKRGLSTSELKLFKTQVRGGILLGADDLENRMNSLGVNEMVYGRYRPVEEIVEEIEKVTEDSMHTFVKNKIQLNKKGVLVIGPKGTKGSLPWLEEIVDANS
jgi:predicted Zn-dependent peptidase